jgi:hypothetical protein
MLPSALRLKLSAVAELEAGPLSQWLCSALAEAELPVVCVETRHMQAVVWDQHIQQPGCRLSFGPVRTLAMGCR